MNILIYVSFFLWLTRWLTWVNVYINILITISMNNHLWRWHSTCVSLETKKRRGHIRLNVLAPKSLWLCCLGPKNMTWHTCTHRVGKIRPMLVLWLFTKGYLVPHASVPQLPHVFALRTSFLVAQGYACLNLK